MPAAPLSASLIARAIEAKERCERAGHPVKAVVIEGKRIELVFAGPDPRGDDFDLADMKR